MASKKKPIKLELTVGELAALAALGHAASTDKARPALCGVWLSVGDDGPYAWASDSYVLAQRRIYTDADLDVTLDAKGLLAAADTVSKTLRRAGWKAGTYDDVGVVVELSKTAGRVCVGVDGLELAVPVAVVDHPPFPFPKSALDTPAARWERRHRVARSGRRDEIINTYFDAVPFDKAQEFTNKVAPPSDDDPLRIGLDEFMRQDRRFTKKTVAAALLEHLGDEPPEVEPFAAFNPKFIARLVKTCPTLASGAGALTFTLHGKLAPAHLTCAADATWRAVIMPVRT